MKKKKALHDLYSLKIGGNAVLTVISQEVTTEVRPKVGAPYKVRNETGKIIVKIKLNEYYSEEAVKNIFDKKFRIYVEELGWRDMIATIDGEKVMHILEWKRVHVLGVQRKIQSLP